MNQAFKLLAGSCAVYVIMAACSGGSGGRSPISSAGSSSGGHSGAQGAGGSNDGGPVPDAMAAAGAGATGPQVDTVTCDKTFAGVSGVYAEKSYPGRTVAQLATLHVIGQFAASNSVATHQQLAADLSDGVARVYCGPTYSSVIFVLP